MALSLDRKAFIDILDEGQGDIGGAMLPPPAGVWGLPPEMLKTLPGYDPDVAKEPGGGARDHGKLGYGPDNRLRVKLSVRNIPIARDPAIILTDQLKNIYIDAELDPIETVNWFPQAIRKDYVIGLNLTAAAVDDPDQQFYRELCLRRRAQLSPATATRSSKSSSSASRWNPNREKRKKLVWEIDRKLQEDGARPIIFHYRAASCRQPYVKGLTIMVNSIYNGWRFEDVWLDR